MKLVAVVIANGFSSEARVAASLLRHRGRAYDPVVLHHAWEGDRESARRFAEASEAETSTFDAGWRPNRSDERGVAAKAASWARLHATLPRLFSAARRFDPDVVYSSQQTWDCYAAAAIASWLRKPHVVHLHYAVGPWLGRTALWELRRCVLVVAISEFIRSQAIERGIPAASIVTVRNSGTVPPEPAPERLQALRRRLGLEDGQPVAAMVARLDPWKGHGDALAAFAATLNRFPAARLLVVGEGPERLRIEQDIRARSLEGKALLLGWRDDVGDLLALADVSLHPSRSEPFGLAVLESAAAGKPVIAYREGGIPEIVADGETGLLVPPGDRAALAAALSKSFADPAAARRMGTAARERVADQFRPELAGEQFAHAIAGLVPQTSPVAVPPHAAPATTDRGAH